MTLENLFTLIKTSACFSDVWDSLPQRLHDKETKALFEKVYDLYMGCVGSYTTYHLPTVYIRDWNNIKTPILERDLLLLQEILATIKEPVNLPEKLTGSYVKRLKLSWKPSEIVCKTFDSLDKTKTLMGMCKDWIRVGHVGEFLMYRFNNLDKQIIDAENWGKALLYNDLKGEPEKGRQIEWFSLVEYLRMECDKIRHEIALNETGIYNDKYGNWD